MRLDPTQWLRPSWSADRVGAAMTTRTGGHSTGRFASLNLADHVGDDAAQVVANRGAFEAAAGARPVFLKQVHGARVVRLTRADARPDAAALEADACLTTEPGVACTVLVADCLPILMAAPHARAVAAVHAGWRGLSAGVLEAALAALCEVAGCAPAQVMAWLGACIGPRRFEVGLDVLQAFGAPAAEPDARLFVAATSPGGEPRKWFANLPQLARERLAGRGVQEISGSPPCSVEDESRFFSFRRDGVTGRMAAAVWIRG